MHPILARGRRLLLFLLLFAQAGLLLAELLARTAGAPRATAAALAVPLILVHAFICLASWYVCRRQPLVVEGLRRLLVAHLMAGLLGVAVLLAAAAVWARAVDRLAPGSGALELLTASIGLIAVYAFLLYSLSAAVHYLVIALEERRLATERTIELQLMAREAELRALKAQVDPHFLFNSLTAIAALVSSAPEQARAMCTELAAFLRSSLRLGQASEVAVADEIALLRRYLAVEQVRFGDRLRVDLRLDPACAQAAVPPLLLQPLVENAIKHGIAQRLEGGTVRIAVTVVRAALRVEIENPCDPDRRRPAGEGIGLANVERRLRARYGDRATLAAEDGGSSFRVRLTLPLRRFEDPERRSGGEPGSPMAPATW